MRMAPQPPSSDTDITDADRAAAASFNAALPDLPDTADARAFFLSSANPSIRALTASLHNHERGRAWHAFLDAVSCGMGMAPLDRASSLLSSSPSSSRPLSDAHWRRVWQSELEHADNEFDEHEDCDYDDGYDDAYYDDEEYGDDADC